MKIKARNSNNRKKKGNSLEKLEEDKFVVEILFEDGTSIHHEISNDVFKMNEDDFREIRAIEENVNIENNDPLNIPIQFWNPELFKQWFSRPSRGRRPNDITDPGFMTDPELSRVIEVFMSTASVRSIICTFFDRGGVECEPMILPMNSVYPNPKYRGKIDEHIACRGVQIKY
jgi:hypothetical protein